MYHTFEYSIRKYWPNSVPRYESQPMIFRREKVTIVGLTFGLESEVTSYLEREHVIR
jgi:hypothetical protein